jgi:hypothetical protein
LLQTRGGSLFAVVARGEPATIAVLAKRAQSYRLVASRAVSKKRIKRRLRVAGFESPNGRWLAVIARLGRPPRSQSALFIIAVDEADKAAQTGAQDATPKSPQ